MESKAEGWSGLKKIILGARQNILGGAVREKQTKKSAALQKKARDVGLQSAIEATTLNSGSSGDNK